jgi:hypothetical protein
MSGAQPRSKRKLSLKLADYWMQIERHVESFDLTKADVIATSA